MEFKMKLILNNTTYEVEHTSDAFSIIEDYCEESGYVMGYIAMNGKNIEVDLNTVEIVRGNGIFKTKKAIIEYA